MIQKGQPAMFGVTFDATLLSVAARVFDASGSPVGPWTAMVNYDGFSYQLPITFSAVGAYSVKKVVFTDGTFTTRRADYTEADDAVQVVDVSGGGSSPGGGSSLKVKMRTNKLKVTMETEEKKL